MHDPPLAAILLLVAAVLGGCAHPAPPPGPSGAPPAPVTVASAQAILSSATANATAQVAEGVVEALFATGHGSGEPTIGVDAHGRVFVTSITFQGGGVKTTILRSDDGGRNWTDVSPRVGGHATHPVTGDPMLFMDAENGRLFDIDQVPSFLCDYISSSDDGGATWTPPTPGCAIPISDHQTIVAAKPALTPPNPLYPKVVYMCSNQLLQTQCARSLDGGHTFQSTAPPFGPLNPNGDASCGALVGHLKAGPDGTVVLPNACGQSVLAVSRDEMASWKVVQVSSEQAGGGPDPAAAIGPDGTFYDTYLAADGTLRLTASKDGGATWTPPVPVLAPGLTAANLPALAAGAGDRIVLAFYATQQPGGFDGISQANLSNVTWDDYLALVQNASSPAPTILTVRVNPPDDPLVRGACGPGRCGRVFDFIDVQVDGDGRPWAPFVDTCKDGCHGQGGGAADGVVATLATGPSLLDGTPLKPLHGAT